MSAEAKITFQSVRLSRNLFGNLYLWLGMNIIIKKFTFHLLRQSNYISSPSEDEWLSNPTYL